MKRILYLILLIPFGIFAQTDQNSVPRNEGYITGSLSSPFSVHFRGKYFTPRWRLGYIKSLNDKSKVGMDIGYGNANSSLIATGDEYALWEIRTEFYYIINPKRTTLSYFALQALYINQKEVFNTQSYFNQENEYLTFDRADYQRQQFGIIPSFGIFAPLSKRIGLNVYTGLGVYHRINKYRNLVNLRTKQLTEETRSSYFRNEGKKIGAQFSLGLRLYYRVNTDGKSRNKNK